MVDTAGGQALVPQQLELVPAQFTGNGWQIITAAPTMAKENTSQPVAVTVATTLTNDSSPGGRKVRGVVCLCKCFYQFLILVHITDLLLLSCWAGKGSRWDQQCRSQSAAAISDHPGSEPAQCRSRSPVSGHPALADCRWTADPHQPSNSVHRGRSRAGSAHPEFGPDPSYHSTHQPAGHPDEYSQSDGSIADPSCAVIPTSAADSARLPNSCHDHSTYKPWWHDPGFACDQ